MRTHLTEFPADFAVPAELLALVAAGKLVDTSWGDDCSPSFRPADCPDCSIRLWVDHPDPEQREHGTGSRFWIAFYDDENQWFDNPLETDDLAEVLAYLADHHGD